MRSSMPILPTSCNWAETRTILDCSSRHAHFLRDQHGIARDPVGVAAGVGVLFVNRAGEHLDRAHKQFAVLFGGVFKIRNEVLEFCRT